MIHMRIFITGGTGFIGKHLIPPLLKDGHTLLVFSKHAPPRDMRKLKSKQLIFLRGDLAHIGRYRNRIRKFRPEVGIHLAWEGYPSDDSVLCERNLAGGLAVTRLLAEIGCKCMIGAGSCHEYGEPGVRVNEESPLRPYNTLYAAKTALCSLGLKIASENNMKLIWLRLFFIYGPGQRSRSLIPHLAASLRAGKRPKFKTPRGGNDFVYVGDIARAFQLVVTRYRKLENGAYNVGSERLTSVAEVAKRVYAFYGKPAPLPLPKKVFGFWSNNSKIRKAVGWKPSIGLNQGIKRMLHNI